MPRYLDLECQTCGEEYDDVFFRTVPSQLIHWPCGGTLEPVFRLRPRVAQWRDSDAVVVFRDASGKIRYPDRNDRETPKGYERVTLKSLREVDAFCKANGVQHEASHFDRGSGRGFDDEIRSPTVGLSERERYERFRAAWESNR